MNKNKNIFLVAQYFMKPQAHVNTCQKGWKNNPENIRWDEHMLITHGLKSKDSHAQVILNLSLKSVVRNTFVQGKTFDELFVYYMQGYSKYIVPVMTQLDESYMQQLVQQLSTELDVSTADLVTQEINTAGLQDNIVDIPYEEIKT